MPSTAPRPSPWEGTRAPHSPEANPAAGGRGSARASARTGRRQRHKGQGGGAGGGRAPHGPQGARYLSEEAGDHLLEGVLVHLAHVHRDPHPRLRPRPRMREDSLHLLAIWSWRFSLASFTLLAKSLAYSVAFVLFFLVHCFFRAICWHLCCWTGGVTRR